MNKLTFLLLTIFLLAVCNVLLAQTPDQVAREASSEYTESIDMSLPAVLWRDMIAARRELKIDVYETLKARYEQEYGYLMSHIGPAPDGPCALVPDPFPGSGTPGDWGGGDVLVSPAGILSPIIAGNQRSLNLQVDSLGNKYAAYISANRDTLCVFRSTNEGTNWSRLVNITPGGITKWHSFDFFVTDSANLHKLGFAATRTPLTTGFGGQVYWISINSDGSGFRASEIASRPAGRGYINPAIMSDGYVWSANVTYWYVAFQDVDSSTGVGNAALAALSQNWGTSWTLDTARSSFNDFDLDINYNFRSDTIAVLLTNDLTVTNPNLRLRFIPLARFGPTSGSWAQFNPASTADPEFGGVLVSNRQDNALMVMYTVTQSGNDNIGYAFSPTGNYAASFWTIGQLVASGPNNERRVDLHCQEAQGAYRVAYMSSGPSRDTVIYTLDPPFASRTIVNVNRDASTSTAPSVVGFRRPGAFGGGVLFAGFGPIGVYYDGSNITPTDVYSNGETPLIFALEQNYPNPFNPSTTIRYTLPQTSFVTLTVYNTLGQQVAQLVNEQQQAGYRDVVFRGEGLASGVYFYRLQAGDFISSKKLLLLK